MSFELWGLDDLRNKKRWLESKQNEYNRLNSAYEQIQEQKNIYDNKVKSARKDIFKDGWFKGSYDWKGSNYQGFEALGEGDVKTEVDNYYRNGTSGLDDVADALLEARNAILQDIASVFAPKFGPFRTFSDLLWKIGTEINSLLN